MKRLRELDSLSSGMVVAADVFASGDKMPLVPQGAVLTDRMIETLRNSSIMTVSVEVFDEQPGEEEPVPDVKPLLDEKLRDEAVTGIRHMFTAIKESASSEENMTTAYQAVKELDPIVDQLVDSLSAESKSLVHIHDLKSYDEYTYHHSLSVAVLSIAIGQNLGLDVGRLRFLGRCAMLHDIGKIMIPNEIINKPGRLTDEEFTIIKGHPKNGYDYLRAGNIGDDSLHFSVLCHHEKINGAGYPLGLRGDKMPVISQILSVADVYDAVTSYRSYRTPMPPSEAVELVMSEAGISFDFDIVKALMAKLELYPINARLELSDRRRGFVVDNKNSMRPVLRIPGSGDTVDLMAAENLTLMITRVLDDKTE